MGDASAEQATELPSAHAQVEAVELELAPLTVAAAGPAAVDLAAPAAELEHAPIIVEAAFEPPDTDAPAAEAEAASAPDLPGFDLMPEPTGTASAQPDPDPVAAAEQPPGELVALEVEPLIATPRSPPVRDDAPPVEIELDPIAVHLAHPEPTPEATERAEGHSLEPAATPATPVLEGEAAQPCAPVREPPVSLVEPAIEEPPAAVALATSPSEPPNGAGEPEPVLSAEQPASVIETLTGPPPPDTTTAARPVATEAPAATFEPLRQTGTLSPAWETVVWRAHPEPPAPIAPPAPADSMASNASSAPTEPPPPPS